MSNPEVSQAVRIPADVEREDRIVAGLTARQVAIFVVAGLVLYAGYLASHAVVPLAGYAAIAVPGAVVVVVLVLGSRDGMSLDRLALAALRQRLSPRVRVAAPEGITAAPDWLLARVSHSPAEGARRGGQPGVGPGVEGSALRFPAESVAPVCGVRGPGEVGVVDLGRDGLAIVCACSTVNFALRTPSEQEALVACFGRYLHALSAPVQILIRTHRLDLSGQINDLRARAGSLPHPALETAALEHADYLDQLAAGSELLRRQVLLVLREPVTAQVPAHRLVTILAGLSLRSGRARAGEAGTELVRAAQTRLARRVDETISLLAPAGIAVTALDAGQATAVLAAACNPDALIPAGAVLAGADDIITTSPDEADPYADSHPIAYPPAGSASYASDPDGTSDAVQVPWTDAPAGVAGDDGSDQLWWAR